MGQRLLGSALLHHLEGYHVQSLDIGNLLGNSDGVSARALASSSANISSSLSRRR